MEEAAIAATEAVFVAQAAVLAATEAVLVEVAAVEHVVEPAAADRQGM